jgi:hypothetical protein
MTYQEINKMVGEVAAAIGGKHTYYQFPDGQAPAPPYAIFYFPGDDPMYADGGNYKKIEILYIELYFDHKDFRAEQVAEAVMAAHGMSWTRYESYIDSERMYQERYEMEVMLDG